MSLCQVSPILFRRTGEYVNNCHNSIVFIIFKGRASERTLRGYSLFYFIVVKAFVPSLAHVVKLVAIGFAVAATEGKLLSV